MRFLSMLRPTLPARPAGLPAPSHFGAALLVLVLAACSTLGGGVRGPVTPIAVDAGQAARQISAFRAENGLGPVSVDPRLMRAAADYAMLMGERDSIGHRLGGPLTRRVSATGYDWGYVGENLAASYSGIADAMAGWKRSPGHRKNLLSPYATHIGIAAVATPPGSKHRNYWALILAMPQPERITLRTAIIGAPL
jgi:hypothetical protein